jgi:hypothetical protein
MLTTLVKSSDACKRASHVLEKVKSRDEHMTAVKRLSRVVKSW